MALHEIERLIEAYEKGETNLREEEVLKRYFSKEDVAAHLKMYQPMFHYYSENRAEQFTRKLPLTTPFRYKWLSVAAVLAIAFGIYTTKRPMGCQEDIVGTFCKPEEALKEVSQTLMVISNLFNKGTATVNYLEPLNEGTAMLNYLNEIEKSTAIIFKTNP